MLYILLVLGLVCQLTRQDNPFGKPNDGSETGCEVGQMMKNDSCISCPRGTYINVATNNCDNCPLDTYSDTLKATECIQCPKVGDFLKYTVDIGSYAQSQCVDICIIPETTDSLYERVSNKAVLSKGERVKTGTEVFFQCFNEYTIERVGNDKGMIIICTLSTALKMRTLCYGDNSPSGDGLICYNNCYKEVTDSVTTYTSIADGTPKVVSKCTFVECQGNSDTCTTISSESEGVKLDQFMCKTDTLTDSELCQEAGLDTCTISRCTTDKCNKPSPSSQLPVVLNLLVLSIGLFFSLTAH